MENFRRHFGLAVLVSELGHVFCCVLPTLFTVLSFAVNIGIIGMAPSWLLDIHEKIHTFEVPIIIFSGVMLVLGWATLKLGRDVDCHDTGCGHPPCDTSKPRNQKIMIVATVLFAINIFIFSVIHRNVFHLDAFSHLNIEHSEEHTH